MELAIENFPRVIYRGTGETYCAIVIGHKYITISRISHQHLKKIQIKVIAWITGTKSDYSSHMIMLSILPLPMDIELSKLLLFTLLLYNEQTEIRQPEVRYAYRNFELYFETTKIETEKTRKEFYKISRKVNSIEKLISCE